ncbi:PucR family transcriptional regulator [Nocardiopsis gilva YIM 90087]|uniref:PucR family transcriptional regulator n=1 Tax=Nocardiopsis gilva YIM 90087 TaxID=1235441 RepID=A0A223S562_9ACTN|nr:helix-turn-helix domain-containing protein [Nocardiopsis gilva]ASU83251.1 PucR family transcriptional regulator [Nocardiopsis gilva YIM 90087]
MTEQLSADVRRRIARICHEVAEDAADLVPDVVDTIRAEIPDYALVPLADHRAWVTEQFRELLHDIAEQRPPRPAQVEGVRELSRARARQGLPIEMLLDAVHITSRETWNRVLLRTRERDPELVGHLVYMVDLVWTWVRVVTGAASDAYSETLRSSQVSQANLRHRFLRSLTAADADADPPAPLARGLGYDPDGAFLALCTPAEAWPEDRLDRMQRALAGTGGAVHCVALGAVVIVLAQRADEERIARRIRELASEEVPIGVGMVRPGLAGAVESITDAEAALARTSPERPTARFTDDWLAIGLARQAERLAPLFADAVRTARRSPHLRGAVEAFADNGLSIAGAGRALQLHPNSVAYRLDRWRDLTGWDVRTGEGLVASLTALRLYPSAAGTAQDG